MNGDSYIFNKSNSIVLFHLNGKKESFHWKKKSKNSKYIFTTSKHVQNSKIVATVKK
jgi:hypothetical protein